VTQAESGPRIIDITDLRAPILTDIQRQALEAAAAHPVIFTEAAILDAARAQTALTDFGPDDFRERLSVWLQAIDEDENASALTRTAVFDMTVRYAATRLRIGDFVRRHPQVSEIKIERPIIVAGLPRSGTTHLLGLLSADRRLRSLPWWEAIAPVPTEADEPSATDPNPRWTRAEAGWRAMDAVLPYMKIMHEFSPDHISEDIELQAPNFSSYLLEWYAHVPRWRDYYLSHDQTGTYAYLKKALQVLTFLRGPNRWVIKCPQHMEQLPALRTVFPDAAFVITHRDPVGSIRSAITMSLYAARMFQKKPNPTALAAYWINRYRRLLQRCVRDRDVLPASQTVDVYFNKWIEDPNVILHEIYERAGLTLSAQTLAELHAYHEAHDTNVPGKIVYDLQRDFGLTASNIRKGFAFYFERFPVEIEVR